jgi:hypothetical protein
MSSFLSITTFHPFGLNLYGERMMKAYHRHWPAEVPLRIYSEGWDKKAHEWLEPFNVLPIESSDWLAAFKYRHAHRDTKDYRMDAVRFSHKIAALLLADQHMSARYLIWIDGDTFTHSPVTLDVLKRWIPTRGAWVSWLDRRNKYPECGFYIIDREHPRHGEMMQRLRNMYADDRLFALKEWHDSYVLQQVVEQAGVGATSLSGPVGYRTGHPFVNGPLGAYMDHMKGKRKQKGRSHRSDLHVRRDEAYWR